MATYEKIDGKTYRKTSEVVEIGGLDGKLNIRNILLLQQENINNRLAELDAEIAEIRRIGVTEAIEVTEVTVEEELIP